MKPQITSTDGIINLPYELKKNNTNLVRLKDVYEYEKNNIILSENITITRPVVLSKDTIQPYLNGKIQAKKTTDAAKPFLGILTSSGNIGDSKNLISKGIIEDNFLIGNVGDIVYVDEGNATLSLSNNNKLSVGYIINTSPTKIYINITKTINELNKPIFLNNPDRDLYATLRYISYNLPFYLIPITSELSCIGADPGGKLYVLTPQTSNDIYVSTNNGQTWTAHKFLNNNWSSIAITDANFNAGSVGFAISKNGSSRLAIFKRQEFYRDYVIEANTWEKIIYVNGIVYGVASDGTNRIIKITKDSSSTTYWAVKQSNMPLSSTQAVAYGNNLYVTVQGADTATSNDGVVWTNHLGVVPNKYYQYMAYTNGVYVAGASGYMSPLIYSNDGITWTQINTVPYSIINGIIGGEAVFYMFGVNCIYRAIAVSVGSWALLPESTSDDWTAMGAEGGTFGSFIALSANKILLIDYTGAATVNNFITGTTWTDIAYGNGIWCAVSGFSSMASVDGGVTWATGGTFPGYTGAIQKVVFYNLKFYAFSHTQLYTSIDGLNWTLFTAWAAQYFFTSSRFVINGILNFIDMNLGSKLTSVDLQDSNLTKEYIVQMIGAPEANEWKSIAHGNNKLVAISKTGVNRIIYSTDNAVTWNAVAAPENNSWEDIVFGNGVFVAISSDGTNRIMTSSDGVSWNPSATPENNSWKSIAFGNGVFYAVSSDGTNRLIYSEDGTNWQTRHIDQQPWIQITYSNGIFVAINENNTAPFYISRTAYL